MKLQGRIIVWPSNLDAAKSRKEGRKLAKGHALQTPRLDEMNDAAKRLLLVAELTAGKSRPPTWWERGGYIVLPKKGTRTALLRAIAREIKSIRAAKNA